MSEVYVWVKVTFICYLFIYYWSMISSFIYHSILIHILTCMFIVVVKPHYVCGGFVCCHGNNTHSPPWKRTIYQNVMVYKHMSTSLSREIIHFFLSAILLWALYPDRNKINGVDLQRYLLKCKHKLMSF